MTGLVLRGVAGLRGGFGGVASVWGLVLAIPLVVAALDPASLAAILGEALGGFAGTLPWVAAAVALVAGLKASGATALVARAFEGRETRMIVLAALLGGLAPFCSCEVIPFIAAMLALGAPLSAIMAFWLSSPLIDPATALITAAALGWEFAAGKAVAAVALGLAGGFAVRPLARLPAFAAPLRAGRDGLCTGCETPLGGDTLWRFWREPPRRKIFRAEAVANARFLVKWLALAYLLQALLVAYVPAAAVAAAVGGDGVASIAIGALVGAPAYLNGYAAPALIAGLMQQGMGAGAAMAFMVAGSVSCIPAMAAVFSLVRSPVFAAYVALGIAGAMAFGAAFGALMG
ncbi:MAG: permease [Defluviicoccus sp.]|nr:permease [Defluviicoccus sp.]MDE0382849.1 permease [Defluviicoccus sp.]